MLALTSEILDRGKMYDAASTIMAQKLAQVRGVGQPAVRVEVNPSALNKYGIGLEDVRTVLNSANANVPKGHFSDGSRMWEVGANDQLLKAIDYSPLLVAYHNGLAVRSGRGRRQRFGGGCAQRRILQWQAVGGCDDQSPARRQHHRHRG